MIQLNLLPDVKLEYIKAQRQRRLFISVSTLVIMVSIGLIVLLFVVSLAQKKHLNDLSEDIVKETAQLKNVPQIDKILTVQNQLDSLTALHTNKPAAANLFEYLNQVTPASVAINTFDINFTEGKITITGTADALSSVNTYIDTLKFTKFSAGKEGGLAFKNVVMQSFGVNAQAKDPSAAATYTIEMGYEPAIFNITTKPKLEVPQNKVTTRSEVDTPSDLFQVGPSSDSQQEEENGR